MQVSNKSLKKAQIPVMFAAWAFAEWLKASTDNRSDLKRNWFHCPNHFRAAPKEAASLIFITFAKILTVGSTMA